VANVLIFGAGGIGLLCARVAHILGAAAIMVADTNSERLTTAKETGAAHVVNPRASDFQAEVSAAFGTRGVDVVIDAAGHQATREAAITILNPGGTLMNIGLGIDRTELPINYLTRQEIRILGSYCYTQDDFASSVDLLVHGRVTEQGWTEERSLWDGGGIFADLVAGRVTSGKVMLRPNMGAAV
jgi:threonine dehydrogenase-like Zn-dependent dehydrogenase